MTYKVSELEGALLDAAVAKAEGGEPARFNVTRIEDPGPRWLYVPIGTPGALAFHPSSDWEHGGPIIEREQIAIARFPFNPIDKNAWYAEVGPSGDPVEGLFVGGAEHAAHAATPLVAAMRAYVASKFGEEIDL